MRIIVVVVTHGRIARIVRAVVNRLVRIHKEHTRVVAGWGIYTSRNINEQTRKPLLLLRLILIQRENHHEVAGQPDHLIAACHALGELLARSAKALGDHNNSRLLLPLDRVHAFRERFPSVGFSVIALRRGDDAHKHQRKNTILSLCIPTAATRNMDISFPIVITSGEQST